MRARVNKRMMTDCLRVALLNERGPQEGHPYPITAQYYLAEMATPQDVDVVVAQADFLKAVKNLVPSVSESEMEHYLAVQKQFSQQHE
jgi:peroxin-6